MNKYLLLSEQEKIKNLINILSQTLNLQQEELNHIKQRLINLIKDNKDKNINDILNDYSNSFYSKTGQLLKDNITPGMQIGIQNENFQIIGYGGTHNQISNRPIEKDTFFSFDSISKTLTTLLITREIRNGNMEWNSTVHDYNPDFAMDATIESILKFTAMIKTEKRIDHLPLQETIDILKKCKENLEEKKQYKNYYEYNDIGFMILRLSIPDCISKLENLLKEVDPDNLTYDWQTFKNNITGGKMNEQFITPDPKGRSILLPGHTGMYGNIEGLMNLFERVFYKEPLILPNEKEFLLKQPYVDPNAYDKTGKQRYAKNGTLQYTTKIAGIYRKPTGITNKYNKIDLCDMSSYTTDNAFVSTGTCGSWLVGDNLSTENKFNYYLGGILTNPYSYIKQGLYPNEINQIPNTNLTVNQRGIIIGYPRKLINYKQLITEYGLLLELLTQYIKETEPNSLPKERHQLIKKLS